MDEIRFITEIYYDIQKMRIMADQRLGQMERDGLDTAKAKELQSWLDEGLRSIEDEIKKSAGKMVRTLTIWNEWLKDVKGIGPVITACLSSWLDGQTTNEHEPNGIERFETASALWKYCGQHVDDETGEAPVRRPGKKINWSPKLRTLCWKISESFVKSGGEDSPYRQEYDRSKKFYRQKYPEKVEKGKTKQGKVFFKYTDLHIHNMAKRKAVKMFLLHYWVKARELKNLPVRMPFVHERLGHEHYRGTDGKLRKLEDSGVNWVRPERAAD